MRASSIAFTQTLPHLIFRNGSKLSTNSCQPLVKPKRILQTPVQTIVPTRTHLTMSVSSPSPIASPDKLHPSVVGHMPIYAQCMLRVNNPDECRKFYSDKLGMTFLTRFDFPDFKFSLFFYAFTQARPPSMDAPQADRADWLWARPEPTMELTWNWCADTYEESVRILREAPASPDEVYVSGNQPPCGFGYLQMAVSDVPAAVSSLRANGVPVIHDCAAVGTESGVQSATVADPDGYHVRLVGPADSAASPIGADISMLDPVFSSVMLRVKDPSKAIPFFENLGFSFLTRQDNAKDKTTDFYFAYTEKKGDGLALCSSLRECTLTLHHVWGTESLPEQPYTNGNVRPYRGYGHIGIIVDDVHATMNALDKAGYKTVRKASPFANVGTIAFIAEPSTDYWIEIIARSGDPPSSPYAQPVLA